tara:strand:+ start:2772 stop:3401 length:630 start_codon:yes stop_codon:yes gene_type:complete
MSKTKLETGQGQPSAARPIKMRGGGKISSTDDFELFRNTVRDVKPLAHETLAVRKTPPPPTPTQSNRDDDEALAEIANEQLDYTELEYGEEAIFQRSSVSRAVMRKLRRGDFAVQAEVDLHGLRVSQAKTSLSRFLQHCGDRGLTCIRVIHGKGNRSPGKIPVLKPMVADWLSHWNIVLAFASARPVDGGTGALYVLLNARHHRRNNDL